MDIQYLFNSSGEYIAFVQGKYVFDHQNNWIGWLPWEDGEVVNRFGEYIATIVDDRLYENSRRDFKDHPGYIDFPGHVGGIDFPDFPGAMSIPSFMKDIDLDAIQA